MNKKKMEDFEEKLEKSEGCNDTFCKSAVIIMNAFISKYYMEEYRAFLRDEIGLELDGSTDEDYKGLIN